MSEVWDQAKRFYRKVPALWRDVIVALLVIFIIMSGLWLYTGQPLSQAPLVVVESGSMMHEDPPYGRIGTIDPGDLILVRDLDDVSGRGLVTMYGALSSTDEHPGEGGRSGYGHPGDVVIYQQRFCPNGRETPIIHRAVTWVEVEQVAGQRVFSYHNENGRWMVRQPDVHLPDIQVEHERSFAHSGWITKGDNPVTNRPADQNQICQGTLIKPEWVIGKARGEIPWIGLLKFIVQGNNWQTGTTEGVCVVGNARAPCDTFTMLWVSLGVVILVPLVWDLVLRLRRGDDEDEGEGPAVSVPPAPIPPPARFPERPRVPPRPGDEATTPRQPARPKPRWASSAEEEARRGDEP